MLRTVRRKTSRGPGRPATGQNALIASRWPPQLLEGIDRFNEQMLLPRPVVLRLIVATFLVERGIIKSDQD
jgi:hypothetical protein